MMSVAVLLFVAAVPTGFFDWSEARRTYVPATVPASYAICYLNLTYGNERREESLRELPPGQAIIPLSSTGPWQVRFSSHDPWPLRFHKS